MPWMGQSIQQKAYQRLQQQRRQQQPPPLIGLSTQQAYSIDTRYANIFETRTKLPKALDA